MASPNRASTEPVRLVVVSVQKALRYMMYTNKNQKKAVITSVERIAVQTKKGESLDTMRVRLDGWPNAKQREFLSSCGFTYYKAKWNWDAKEGKKVYTEAGYWGAKYDAKIFKALSKKAVKPEVKAEVKAEPKKAEPKKSEAKKTTAKKATAKKSAPKKNTTADALAKVLNGRPDADALMSQLLAALGQ
jgi:hypothetical protein